MFNYKIINIGFTVIEAKLRPDTEEAKTSAFWLLKKRDLNYKKIIKIINNIKSSP